MIGRLLRFFFFCAIAALIVNRLFSRKQKRTIREIAKISAWVLLGRGGEPYAVLVSDDAVFQAYSQILIEIKL